jgi:hypothetical protein
MSRTRRFAVGLLVVVIALAVAAAGGASLRRGGGIAPVRIAAAGWGPVRTVFPISEHAFAPTLAVNEGGRAVAAWFSGSPPRVTASAIAAGTSSGPSTGSAAAPSAHTAFAGIRIMAALGTAGGGVGRPVTIGRNGDDEQGGVMSAMSGAGVGYVTWQEADHWDLAVARGARFAAARALSLPAGAQVIALASGRSGPVDVVWIRFGVHGAPGLYAAPLTGTGAIGHTLTVADLGSLASDIEVVLNDSGALAATWVNGEQGLDPRKPALYPAVRAVLCPADSRCRAVQTLRLGPRAHQFVNTAITLSDNDTATILDGGVTEVLHGGEPVEIGPHGLWGAVSRHGRPFRLTPEISPTGNFPVASASGRGGAVAMFNVGVAPIDTLAYASLRARGARFTASTVLPDHETINQPVVASNLAGNTVGAWFDSPREVTNAQDSIHAVLGPATHLSAPATVAPPSSDVAPDLLAAGIDGRGNAIILWEGVGSDGFSHGIFAALSHT